MRSLRRVIRATLMDKVLTALYFKAVKNTHLALLFVNVFGTIFATIQSKKN